MSDLIDRQTAIAYAISGRVRTLPTSEDGENWIRTEEVRQNLLTMPSAQPERLTDDDFETIRIHLNAYKENLCNQRRWKEAEEYQRIIDRFMGFASTQQEQKVKGKWIGGELGECSICGHEGCASDIWTGCEKTYCPNCGHELEGA